ncbi:hypothetical protein FRC01_005784 [Tulasnella sp. 417]|nr:hypothetical protein FRC01_005784 [Tulasnella sp. 417]
MSTFGTLFRVTTYGESHCASVGCIVDGVPPGLKLTAADIQVQLSRRRPGQSNLTTPRNEKDLVLIQSGVEHDTTLGTPIGLLVKNEDQRPHDYTETDLYPRPSHADYTYLTKYGIKASSGGGRASARETIGRVASGAIADIYLRQVHGIEIVAFVSSVGKISIPSTTVSSTEEDEDHVDDVLNPEYVELLQTVTREKVDEDITRCPHAGTREGMKARIIRAKDANDSIGGTVTCVIRGLPAGLGEPVFDKFHAKLAHAMLSIPATKAFEIGSGFAGTRVPGSRHNDPFVLKENGGLATSTNWSGGVQGGITNGEDVYFKVGFKSPATISRPQETAQYDGTPGTLAARGRHDPCVVPRAVPIVESMAALVVMEYVSILKYLRDHVINVANASSLMIQNARRATAAPLPPVTSLPPTMVLPPGSK